MKRHATKCSENQKQGQVAGLLISVVLMVAGAILISIALGVSWT